MYVCVCVSVSVCVCVGERERGGGRQRRRQRQRNDDGQRQRMIELTWHTWLVTEGPEDGDWHLLHTILVFNFWFHLFSLYFGSLKYTYFFSLKKLLSFHYFFIKCVLHAVHYKYNITASTYILSKHVRNKINRIRQNQKADQKPPMKTLSLETSASF